MSISIGSNIKRLRKERNMTQESLAELLGVSYQAVSKWENNIGYPDITLLPALSSALDTSIDTIMGTDRSSAALERILLDVGEKAKTGYLREAYEMAKEALLQYPKNDVLLYSASGLALSLFPSANDEERCRLSEEIRTMTDRIEEYSNSDFLKAGAKYTACQAYSQIKNKRAAADIALGLPDISSCRQYTLPSCLEGEEKDVFMAKTMYLIVTLFTTFVHQSSPEPLPDIRTARSHDRASAEAYLTVWDIAFSRMKDGEKIKRQNFGYMSLHIAAASGAMENGDINAVLPHLQEAAECASLIDLSENLPLEVISSNHALKQLLPVYPHFLLPRETVLCHNISYCLLHGFLESSHYDDLKDSAEWQQLVHRLEETAK